MNLVPADPRALVDLATFVARAAHADPGGAARLVASGSVLAVTACPLRGNGLPTVLGLRALALAGPAQVDTTVALASLAERLARTTAHLPVPPTQVLTASWAGLLPPRSAWQPVAEPVPGAVFLAAATQGAARVAAGEPREQVWSEEGDGAPAGFPAGLAWAASALGFLPDGEEVALARHGRWVRASTSRGHVLGRPPALL